MHEEVLERERTKGMYYYEVGEYSGDKYLPYWDLTVHKYVPIALVIGMIKAVRRSADLWWFLADQWVLLAKSTAFEKVVMVVVVVNTVTMSMEHTRDSTVGLFWGDICDPSRRPWQDCSELGGNTGGGHGERRPHNGNDTGGDPKRARY